MAIRFEPDIILKGVVVNNSGSRTNFFKMKKPVPGGLLMFFPVNFSYNSLLYLENSGGDTFLKNNSVSFVSSFLIGRVICHTQFFFRMQDLCPNILKGSPFWSNNLYCFGNWSLKTPIFTKFLTTTPIRLKILYSSKLASNK